MAGLSNYSAQKMLDWLDGRTSMPAATTCYLALFTAVGTDANAGFTEAAYTSYARQSLAAAFPAASGTSPSSSTSTGAVTFPACTNGAGGVIETHIAWGIFDALTVGNLLMWDYLGTDDWRPFTCTLASPGVLTVPAHGYSNGNSVVVSSEFGGSLPTTGGSWTGLLTVASAATDTFTAGVNTTSTGSGMVKKVTSQQIVTGTIPTFNIGSIILKAA